ncbi:NADH dehydrogenase [ubiquinone] iron-sulfur protein 5-A [Sesamum angolense]|uniref:NADH dehydrogenase [ubiquinone] iron-sulfur protein 5 n=1 Tax=Sesamum angolense TaxID=2727404 RepID=A0AAE2BLN5_9LAMI|nr:NADH dehydrogenase [ubiquinone] iron-sulfur protein 5-A [Sesamum angolense]
MAWGWEITGNKGRCYDFWIDFSDCMSRCREPKDCALLREDYLECLHHSKEFQRRNGVYKEEQRQLRVASEKGKGGGRWCSSLRNIIISLRFNRVKRGMGTN